MKSNLTITMKTKANNLQKKAALAVSLVTDIIDTLTNINKEAEEQIKEISHTVTELQHTEQELRETTSVNNKVITKFKALLEDDEK